MVFHWSLAPTINENQARWELARWMAGNKTVKDLDKKARLAETTFQYFPMWFFKYRQAGEERISLEPAAATSISELRRLPLTAGDLRSYDPSLDAQSQPPTVPLTTAQAWRQQNNPGTEILETSLVHIPLFTFKYIYRSHTYIAIIEAATSKTLATIYPPKSEALYLLAGAAPVLSARVLPPPEDSDRGGQQVAAPGAISCPVQSGAFLAGDAGGQ